MYAGASGKIGVALAAVCLCVACSTDSASSHAPDATRRAPDAALPGAPSEEASAPNTPEASTRREPVTLAEAPTPTRLVLDDANVFFTTCSSAPSRGAVLRVPLRGGAAVEVVSGPHCAVDLALQGNTVYVAGLDGNGVSRVAKGGGKSTTVLDASEALVGIAADDVSLYLTTPAAVLVAPLAGGELKTLATVPGQRDSTRPVVDAARVYWGDPALGALYDADKTTGDVTTLAVGFGGLRALALSGFDVYVAAGYVVVRVPTTGGAPVTLGTAAGAEELAIAVDDTGVYATSSGVVWRLPLGGGTPVSLATTHGDVDSIALGGGSVFWTAAPACDASDAARTAGCPGKLQRLDLD